MTREWKPGDVATDGVFAVLRSARGGFAYADGSFVADEACGILAYRPLVVLDPEDREQVERLATEIARLALARGDVVRQGKDATARRVGHIQDALRSLTAPPKPDEPQGLGAVVEDAEGKRWLRYSDLPGCSWMRQAMQPVYQEYADIDAVKILSEGVTS